MIKLEMVSVRYQLLNMKGRRSGYGMLSKT